MKLATMLPLATLISSVCLFQTSWASPSSASVPERLLSTVRDYFVASPMTRQKHPLWFDPLAGQRGRGSYQRAYGYRGAKLIDVVGRGYSETQLRRLGAI